MLAEQPSHLFDVQAGRNRNGVITVASGSQALNRASLLVVWQQGEVMTRLFVMR
jgi:hypothetical protein